MSRTSTPPGRLVLALLLVCLIGGLPAKAQGGAAAWRRIGNSTRDMGLPGPAGGPVARIWFDPNGRLVAKLPAGSTFEAAAGEDWRPASAVTPPGSAPDAGAAPAGVVLPEPDARLASSRLSSVLYAAGAHLWRSENGGASWKNQTDWKGVSLLGGPIHDLAVDPANPDRVAAATSTGVWISQDGGLTWSGQNGSLPSLPVRRILATPRGPSGLTIGIEEKPGQLAAWEWAPGRRDGWVRADSSRLMEEESWKSSISRSVSASIATAARRGQVWVGGGLDGRLWTSVDGANNWRLYESEGSGAVERLWISSDGRALLAALAGNEEGRGTRVLRSLNGGQYWDDLTANLPPGQVYGITADAGTGAIYVATREGVFLTLNSLLAPAPATAWAPLKSGLPAAPVRDIVLDGSASHLFAALDGYGVFVAIAPHRALAPLLVSAGDFGMRSVAPGALLTLIGARLQSASANQRAAQVLATTETESQVQLPFDVAGESMNVTLNWGAGEVQVGIPLRSAAPSILVDREGTPMVLDAESGLQSDAMTPLRPGSRLQILATGLGRVEPEWPAGLAAPLENPPRVAAPVRVLLDGQPAVVTRATLAPGYIGFYLVEIEAPALLDAGPSELWVEAAGSESNRVRVYVEQ